MRSHPLSLLLLTLCAFPGLPTLRNHRRRLLQKPPQCHAHPMSLQSRPHHSCFYSMGTQMNSCSSARHLPCTFRGIRVDRLGIAPKVAIVLAFLSLLGKWSKSPVSHLHRWDPRHKRLRRVKAYAMAASCALTKSFGVGWQRCGRWMECDLSAFIGAA